MEQRLGHVHWPATRELDQVPLGETVPRNWTSVKPVQTLFFRLLDKENKSAALADAVVAERAAVRTTGVTFRVRPEEFRAIPGAPLAYWAAPALRRRFAELPSFEGRGRRVQHGAATTADFRFLRTWWEVAPVSVARGQGDTPPDEFRRQTFDGRAWVCFAKGGEHSPFYSEVHLLVNWRDNGAVLEKYLLEKLPYLGNNADWVLHREADYFSPGLTWPIKNRSSFKPWPLPAGCTFAHVGAAAFFAEGSILAYQALMSSGVFTYLLRLMAGWNYEVGVIQRTPTPDIPLDVEAELEGLAFGCIESKRSLDSAIETSHWFNYPSIAGLRDTNLEVQAQCLEARVTETAALLASNQTRIDELADPLYGITQSDRLIDGGVSEPPDRESSDSTLDDVVIEHAGEIASTRADDTSGTVLDLTRSLLSYGLGCSFGRWDVRIALDPTLAARTASPFGPMPVCSPGMLVGPDGLPARKGGVVSEEWLRARPDAITLPLEGSVQHPAIDKEYPLKLAWDGILVDDPEHPADLVVNVRAVFELLWGDRADALEGEACGTLGLMDLRDDFRNPRGFFEDHVRRYSKSRRKAPIYWLLQSNKRSYSLWVYYHRLDADTLFKALTYYVDPKVQREEGRLADLRSQKTQAGSAGSAARQAERAIDRQEALIAELRDFRDKLNRAASLGVNPDLDDGVVLNAAPLWELMPWKVAKDYWQELLKGEYGWSSIGKQLRAKKLVAAP